MQTKEIRSDPAFILVHILPSSRRSRPALHGAGAPRRSEDAHHAAGVAAGVALEVEGEGVDAGDEAADVALSVADAAGELRGLGEEYIIEYALNDEHPPLSAGIRGF